MRTVSFVPPLISTGDPDIAKIHKMVTAAVDRSEGKSVAKAAGPKAHKKGYNRTRQETVGGSIGNLHDGYAANASSNLSDSC